ncbi:hypothetical protein C0J52_23158 [Blattella germanica]|nr:hypothetical protein C0J52_23158 [Blattella germanica]
MEAEQRVKELGGGSSGGLMTLDETSCNNNNNNNHHLHNNINNRSSTSSSSPFSVIGSSMATAAMTGCSGGGSDATTDKQLLLWERRILVSLGPPDVPFLVAVDVTGTNSVTVRFQEPEHQDSAICTKFKGWRDVDHREPRFAGRLHLLDDLFSKIRHSRPECAAEIKATTTTTAQSGETPSVQRRNQRSKKTAIKQLFTVASKFQKNLRRGVFLACLLYHEDKVLVTNEDFLPVACTWDDVKSLRQDMERSLSSSAVHFRIKLLQAAAQMQAALCIQDLGQLYHKPIRDSQGTLVISTVNYVRSPKTVSVLNSRWLPLSKVQKKLATHEEPHVGELLMASIQEQITYHQVSSIRLNRGLYLGYLKMRSSVDLIQVVVPSKAPNVLPHCKIRDNPHVSSLYDAEVVDLSPEVSFLIVVPRAESACAVPGQTESLLQRDDLIALPVQVFEMVHLGTYQRDVISRYSRLSCILELDTVLAHHSHREAFSSSEVAAAKDRLAQLQDFQVQLNSAWKGVRWLMDVLTFARDRGCGGSATTPGVAMRNLLALNWSSSGDQGSDRDVSCNGKSGISSCGGGSLKRSLLQLPPRDPKLVKSSTSRGSWPGPGVSPGSVANLLTAELSKSEQHLSTGRSGSSGSHSHSGELSSRVTPRLPPSRSEDTLLLAKQPPPAIRTHTRSRSSTITGSGAGSICSGTSVSASTSPLLSTRGASGGSVHSLSSSDDTTSPASTSTSKLATLPALPAEKQAEEEEDIATVATVVPAPAPGILQNCSLLKNHDSTVSKTSGFRLDGLGSIPGIGSGGDINFTTTTLRSTQPPIQWVLGAFLGDREIRILIYSVYAAYETGLASGTSLKLHVTPWTTAREVVDLVVKQLNMAVVLKGKDGPIYPSDKLKNFCLVAVIGARERCLRDDFKPLQLQNPWKKGRLYVRQKQDVLAALEQSSRHTAYL